MKHQGSLRVQQDSQDSHRLRVDSQDYHRVRVEKEEKKGAEGIIASGGTGSEVFACHSGHTAS